MKVENVTSSRNALRSVFSCRNSRYGANQETSEVKLYFSNSIENRSFLETCDGGGGPYKNIIVFSIEALSCQRFQLIFKLSNAYFVMPLYDF